MGIVLLPLGLLLLGLVTVDVFATTTGSGSTSGAGPLTARLARCLWRAALAVHRRRPSHRGLHLVGSGLTIGTVLSWIVAIWVSWTLVFASMDGSVVDTATEQPVGLGAKAYFAGYSVLTLGNGDYVPGSTPWQLATLAAAATGLALVTLAVTYILNVVQAGSQRRALATMIWTFGDDVEEVVRRAAADPQHVNQQLWSLVEPFAQVREHHVAFPVLHYLHATDRHRALPAQAAKLAGAVDRLRNGPAGEALSPSILDSVDRALREYLEAVAPYDPHRQGAADVSHLEASTGWEAGDGR